MRVADCKTFGPINKRLEGVSVIMRSEQFKTVTDRELAEQYLAMAEEDKASVEKEIIDRFVAAKAKPRTAKGAYDSGNNRPISRWTIRKTAFRIYRKYRGSITLFYWDSYRSSHSDSDYDDIHSNQEQKEKTE